MNMIKLSTGTEVSEDTVVSALKKAGINVEPPKPKHIFQAGDVARSKYGYWRLIIKINGKLYAVDKYGYVMGEHSSKIGQEHFEEFGYKFIGKQSDLI